MSLPAGGRRIALFVPSLRGGGAERIMVTLANAFACRGYPVDLVLTQAVGPYLTDVSPNVRIVDLASSRMLTSVPKLVWYLRREKPTSLLSTLRHANIAVALARALARSRTRLVLREANFVSRSVFNGARGMIELALYRWAYRSADSIVGISEGVRRSVELTIGNKQSMVAIHNPIDVPKVLQYANHQVDHPFFSEGVPVIIAVGRLVPQKDFATLLRAFAKLRQQLICKLLILGEGELRSELQGISEQLAISEDVSLPGFQGNPFAYMARSSLFVLSSAWEGFGNVLVEAMACGIPVVSTNCQSGPAEILENGKWGRLVQPGDSDALAAEMLQAITSPPPAASERVQDFAVDRIVDAYLSVVDAGLVEPT